MGMTNQRALSWGLILLMSTAPSYSLAQAPGATNASPQSYLTSRSFGAVIVRPRQALTSKSAEMWPVEIATAAGQQHVGVDPLDIVEVLAMVEPPAQGPPGYGIVIRFSKPYDLGKIQLPITWPVEKTELDGKPYIQSQHPMMPGFLMPDATTLLAAPHAFMQQMLANSKQPQPGALSRILSKSDGSSEVLAVVMLDPIRPMLNGLVAQASDAIPPPFQDVRKLPDLINAARLDLRLVNSPGASLAMLTSDEAKATELTATLDNLFDTGQQLALAQVASELEGDDPIQVATMQYSQRITKIMIDALRPTQSGRVVKISQDAESNMQIATIGVLVALLLPAVQAAREAARRMSASNNLKQIAVAMHNYHDTYGKLPPQATYDDQGKPLLSWRVHLLPFVEQSELYDQFHLDEPWNSEHNAGLIEHIPMVYRNPSSSAEPQMANFLVPTGEGSIFANKEGTGFRDILDGTSNTIMVVEADDSAAVIWTKPDDLAYVNEQPLRGLGSAHPGGFQVSLADGSVRFISNTIDQDVLLRLFQMADGKPVQLD